MIRDYSYGRAAKALVGAVDGPGEEEKFLQSDSCERGGISGMKLNRE